MTNTILNYVEFNHISIYSTKWTGQARKYLTQVMVHMQTEHSKVCAKWWRTEYFPVWTNQTQFISILSHIYSASFCKVVEMSWWIAIIELLICSGPDSFFSLDWLTGLFSIGLQGHTVVWTSPLFPFSWFYNWLIKNM